MFNKNKDVFWLGVSCQEAEKGGEASRGPPSAATLTPAGLGGGGPGAQRLQGAGIRSPQPLKGEGEGEGRNAQTEPGRMVTQVLSRPCRGPELPVLLVASVLPRSSCKTKRTGLKTFIQNK